MPLQATAMMTQACVLLIPSKCIRACMCTCVSVFQSALQSRQAGDSPVCVCVCVCAYTQAVTFNETLCLRGLSLTATMMLVFEVYVAKQPLAGMPSREDLCAWSYVNALMYGEVSVCVCVCVCVCV